MKFLIVYLGFLLSALSPLKAQTEVHKPEFVHAVYFWLKDDITADQKKEFIRYVRTLEEIPSVQNLHIGYPAGTPRAIVDNSYDIALVVTFKDRAGHDAYQVAPIHLEMKSATEAWIEKLQIYDSVSD